MECEKSWLSNREWVFVIILVIMSQFLLHQYASNMMNETQVINYISFSGTIVSIILAVLAIIYSFFQSITQQGNSDKIASNLESLTGVASMVNASVDTMTNQVESLNTVVSEVQSLPSDIVLLVTNALEKLNKEHVVDIKEILSTYIEQVSEGKKTEAKSNEEIRNEAIGEVGADTKWEDIHCARWSILTTTMLSCFLINRLNVVDVLVDIVKSTIDSPKSLRELTILFTGATGAVSILKGIELVKEYKDPDGRNDYYYISSDEATNSTRLKLIGFIGLYYRDAYTDITEKFDKKTSGALINALKLTSDSGLLSKEEIMKKVTM